MFFLWIVFLCFYLGCYVLFVDCVSMLLSRLLCSFCGLCFYAFISIVMFFLWIVFLCFSLDCYVLLWIVFLCFISPLYFLWMGSLPYFLYIEDFSIWTEYTFSFRLGLTIHLMAKITVVSYLLIIHIDPLSTYI
jgi:hypothetical protein